MIDGVCNVCAIIIDNSEVFIALILYPQVIILNRELVEKHLGIGVLIPRIIGVLDKAVRWILSVNPSTVDVLLYVLISIFPHDYFLVF